MRKRRKGNEWCQTPAGSLVDGQDNFSQIHLKVKKPVKSYFQADTANKQRVFFSLIVSSLVG